MREYKVAKGVLYMHTTTNKWDKISFICILCRYFLTLCFEMLFFGGDSEHLRLKNNCVNLLSKVMIDNRE